MIGTGGYDHNREMVKHYINAPVFASAAVPTNIGDGHIMAMEFGATMRNVNEAYHISVNMCGTDNYQITDSSADTGTYISEENTTVI